MFKRYGVDGISSAMRIFIRVNKYSLLLVARTKLL